MHTIYIAQSFAYPVWRGLDHRGSLLRSLTRACIYYVMRVDIHTYIFLSLRRLPSPPVASGPGICFFCLPLPPAASRPRPGVIDRAGAIGDGFGVGGRV